MRNILQNSLHRRLSRAWHNGTGPDRAVAQQLGRLTEEWIRESAAKCATTGLVALDERQYQQARYPARPRMDAQRRHRRLPELRRRPRHSAGGRQASRLHDAGVEGRLQVRHYPGRPTRHGRGHRRLARLERERRPMGPRPRSNEEVRVERDGGPRWQALHRHTGPSPLQHRAVPESVHHEQHIH